MADTREQVLAANIVERMKASLDEALEDEDYTRIVELSDSVLGEDEQAEDLFALVDDGSGQGELELDSDFDDLDDDFDDEEDDEDEEEELSFEDDSELEDDDDCDEDDE